MSDTTHTWMSNPATDGVWQCPTGMVAHYTARGWVPCDAPGETVDGLYDESTAEGPAQTGFDPAEHVVDDVNAHLEKFQDVPGEVERVLELERAGKNRTTVVDPRPGGEDDEPTPGD